MTGNNRHPEVMIGTSHCTAREKRRDSLGWAGKRGGKDNGDRQGTKSRNKGKVNSVCFHVMYVYV